MKEYLDIVKKVLDQGKWKSPVRKNHQTGKWEPVDGGVRTLACANVLFSHDMKNGFPLLTTKKMAFKTMCVELEGFIKGITDKKWYQDRGCKIWNEWANPEAVNYKLRQQYDPDGWNGVVDDPRYLELKKNIQVEENDLGPIYGYQWRRFGQEYPEPATTYQLLEEEISGVTKGTDQLKNIVDTLTNNPMDRRMVCSAWNPNQMNMMALPPCHWGWNVTVIGDELNLCWIQRSVDVPYGLCFNIASYGLLLCLLAKVGGFKRGNLSAMLTDCHIYENQIEGCKEQLKREPGKLPELYLDDFDDIFNWSHNQVRLEGYSPMGKIHFGDIVV